MTKQVMKLLLLVPLRVNKDVVLLVILPMRTTKPTTWRQKELLLALIRRAPKRYDSDDDSLPDLLPRDDHYDSDSDSDSSEELPSLISRAAYYGSDSDSEVDDEPGPNSSSPRERPYVPMSYSAPEEDVVPQTIVTVKSMTGVGVTQRLFRVLLDSGATFEAMIKASAIPDNVVLTKIPSINVRTTSGSFKLKGMKFPQFSFTSHLAPIEAVVFDSESCGYGIILGRACLKKMGVDRASKEILGHQKGAPLHSRDSRRVSPNDLGMQDSHPYRSQESGSSQHPFPASSQLASSR
jgi:hypothetical protein